jgi:hypothetical protein
MIQIDFVIVLTKQAVILEILIEEHFGGDAVVDEL